MDRGRAQIEMKVEQKLSDFLVKIWKWNENMKTETEFHQTEMEMDFFGGSRNKTAFSGGISV
jgi:hypothetical protein